jgi:SPP1 gp7 family putative phage head morphogenesis protein
MPTVKQNQKKISREIALRRAMLNKPQKTAVKGTAKWLYPHSQELFYRKQLLDIVDLIDQAMNKFLIPQLPTLQAELLSKRPDIKNDDFVDDINAITVNMGLSVKTAETDPELLASTVGGGVSQFNREQMAKMMRDAFGVNIFSAEPWLTTQLDLFTTQNVSLINDLSSKAIKDIHGIVTRGFAAGSNIKDIQSDLEGRIGFTKNRAKLIARDQTSKLNGQLTQLRQTDNGISKYVWVTAGDERVRPTHEANNGQTFSWDDPPATGHPGSDYNCRCIASPKLDELL